MDDVRQIEEAREAVARWAETRVGAEAAQDVAQDAAAGALEALAEGRAIGSLRAFMFGIAKHKVADLLRARKAESLDVDLPAAAQSEARAEAEAEAAAAFELLRQAARGMASRNLALRVARLHYVKGLPLRVIARDVGKTQGALKTLLFRLRQRARDLAAGRPLKAEQRLKGGRVVRPRRNPRGPRPT